jgi:hypothetical protein
MFARGRIFRLGQRLGKNRKFHSSFQREEDYNMIGIVIGSLHFAVFVGGHTVDVVTKKAKPEDFPMIPCMGVCVVVTVCWPFVLAAEGLEAFWYTIGMIQKKLC